MVNCYFSEWREMKSPAAFESLLTAVFASGYGKNPVVEKWCNNEILFSGKCRTFLGNDCCSTVVLLPNKCHFERASTSRAHLGPRELREAAGNGECARG